MPTIRKYGTPLVRQPDGSYLTEDGRFEVACQDYDTWCDEPHPVKLPREKWEMVWVFPDDYRKRPYQKLKKGYYCEGGAEHQYSRWHIYDLVRGDYAFDDGPGAYATFGEAAQALTDELARAGEAPRGREHAYHGL
jgi:hypothetical protein